MTVNWKNPYSEPSGCWLKGSLHTHSAAGSPCSIFPMQELLQTYQGLGYDFLSVSDHMTVSQPRFDGLTLLPGLEWNSRIGFMPNGAVTYQDHLGIYGSSELLDACIAPRSVRAVFQEVENRHCLVVANHPNWTEGGHHDLTSLMQMAPHIHGMEIYNALIEYEEGSASAEREWDRLLAADYRVLGLVSDDAHEAVHAGKAWLMVDCDAASPSAVLGALREGRFYCTTGIVINALQREGDTVSIVLEEPARIDVIGRAGKLLFRGHGDGSVFSFTEADTPYVRFHVQDRNHCQAWSQPFFRS